MQAQEISRQLLRSAMSIGANIAEGHGRHEGAEYIHYLIIAQGSANE
jgi:four helix bundle protein